MPGSRTTEQACPFDGMKDSSELPTRSNDTAPMALTITNLVHHEATPTTKNNASCPSCPQLEFDVAGIGAQFNDQCHDNSGGNGIAIPEEKLIEMPARRFSFKGGIDGGYQMNNEGNVRIEAWRFDFGNAPVGWRLL